MRDKTKDKIYHKRIIMFNCALHQMVLRTTFPSTIQTRIFVQLWDYDTTLGKQLAKPIYQIWKTKGEDILLQNEKKRKEKKG